jgi:phage baseplate assembly protein W
MKKRSYEKKFQYYDIDLKFRKWESVMNNSNIDWNTDLNGNGISNNDISHMTSVASINQSLKNILLTNIYERPFDVMFGGNTYNQLFESLDDISLVSHSADIIYELLTRYEKRVDINNVLFKEGKFQNNKHIINITIEYVIPTSANVIRFTFPIERIK